MGSLSEYTVTITKLPQFSTLEVNSLLVVEGQEIPSDQLRSLKANNPTGIKGNPLDSFSYIVSAKDGNGNFVSSNEATMLLNYKCSGNTPTVIDSVFDVQLNTEVPLSDLIDVSDTFDRIKITHIDDDVSITENGSYVDGDEFALINVINNLSLKINAKGARSAHKQIKFLKGNENGFFADENKLDFNTIDYASIISSGFENEVKPKFRIIDSFKNAEVELRFNLTEITELKEFYVNGVLVTDTNEVVSKSFTLDENGTLDFNCYLDIFVQPMDKNIYVDLVSVNSNNIYISDNSNLEINIKIL